MCGIGLIAKVTPGPAESYSTTRCDKCGIDTIGLVTLAKTSTTPQQALAALIASSR